MKILITGGAGFIGSATVRYLINKTKNEVLNVDKLTYAGNLESLESVDEDFNYSFKKIDINNFSLVKDCFLKFKPDAVMHLAAESHVDKSIEGPREFINTNIIGTFNMLEASRYYFESLTNVTKSKFRFLHVSTDEVYGDLGNSKNFFTEESKYSPSSPYAASKAGSDHIVKAWFRTFNLPVLITNCSNNYGPYHFPEKLIPKTILNALNQVEIPVYGNGKQVRDWLYVEDHVDALYTILKNGKLGETYNIGGNNEKSNIEVVNKVCSLLDERSPRKKGIYSDLISFVEDRPGHDIRYAIDSSKLKEELNWKPIESFETGLTKTVEWYLANDSWLSKVTV